MKKILLLMIAFLLITGAMTVYAQNDPAKGTVVAARSNYAPPGRPHTHLFFFIPETGPQPSIPSGETPASIACVYGVFPAELPGPCLKGSGSIPTGGTQAVVLVDYGRYSALQSDLNTFSTQWGLPAVTLHEICSPGPPPCPDNTGTDWDVEEALDIEWAHAMAPHAAIYLSEWTNDPLTDGAETAGANAAVALGGGEVSNSWTYNGGEFSGELGLDPYFQVNSVVFFAAAGDAGLGPEYPSISPFVVSAGGTHINRDSNGNFLQTESCWSGSGGGISIYEPRPSYQNIPHVKAIVGNFRGTPDMSADADPASGVSIYNSSTCHGFCIVGGTSVASPVLAGYVNGAGHFLASTNAELYKTYHLDSANGLGYWYTPIDSNPHPPFFDITTGGGGRATPGWDNCTGIGSPRTPSNF
jgi:kumamolisin